MIFLCNSERVHDRSRSYQRGFVYRSESYCQLLIRANHQAREYVDTLKDAITEGTDAPSVEITDEPAFPRTYKSLTGEATESSGSETKGDGWYKTTFAREGIRLATVDFVVQSVKIIHRRGEHTYTVKLDCLNGFTLRIEFPPQKKSLKTSIVACFDSCSSMSASHLRRSTLSRSSIHQPSGDSHG